MKLAFIAVLLMIFSGTVRSQDSLYNIADLESLQIQKNYREFIRHAHDIRPSQRDKHWREMVLTMSTEYLEQVLDRKDWSEETYKEVEVLASWMNLREDLFFTAKRDRYLLGYFKNCLAHRTVDACQKQMIESFHHLTGEIESVSKLIQLFSDYTPALELAPLIKFVSTHKQANFYCANESFAPHLLNFLLNSLSLQFNAQEAETVLAKYTSQSCWNEFSTHVKKMLTKVPAGLADRYYRLLLARRMMSLEEEDLFLSYYFLLSPGPGDTLNRSWNRVAELVENYDRRRKVTTALLALDPLPGKLFAEKSKDKLVPFFKHFKKTFPEYLDRYVETCLKYMAGEGQFPNGNPTIECRDLFNSSNALNWPMDSVKTQYSALKK